MKRIVLVLLFGLVAGCGGARIADGFPDTASGDMTADDMAVPICTFGISTIGHCVLAH